MISKNKKRLIGVTFNPDGKIDSETLFALRKKGWRDSNLTQTIIFDDATNGGQAAFIFEIYDVKDTSIIQRLRHFFRKRFATTLSNVWNGVFVYVIIKSKTNTFPVHGAD